MGLIILQPDFGTTVILAVISLMMIYLAGGRILHLAGIAALFIPGRPPGSSSTRVTGWPAS